MAFLCSETFPVMTDAVNPLSTHEYKNIPSVQMSLQGKADSDLSLQSPVGKETKELGAFNNIQRLPPISSLLKQSGTASPAPISLSRVMAQPYPEFRPRSKSMSHVNLPLSTSSSVLSFASPQGSDTSPLYPSASPSTPNLVDDDSSLFSQAERSRSNSFASVMTSTTSATLSSPFRAMSFVDRRHSLAGQVTGTPIVPSMHYHRSNSISGSLESPVRPSPLGAFSYGQSPSDMRQDFSQLQHRQPIRSVDEAVYDVKEEQGISRFIPTHIQERKQQRHEPVLRGSVVDPELVDSLFSSKCPHCEMTFSSIIHYRSHVRSHQEVRQFQCNECPLSFLRKHDYLRHLKTHSGQKEFECHLCNKAFARRDGLTRHFGRRHPEYKNASS